MVKGVDAKATAICQADGEIEFELFGEGPDLGLAHYGGNGLATTLVSQDLLAHGANDPIDLDLDLSTGDKK